MIPHKTDPRWKTLVESNTDYGLKGLATRMMLTRARLIGAKKDQQSVKAAIDVAFDYFTKNERNASEDVRAIFG